MEELHRPFLRVGVDVVHRAVHGQLVVVRAKAVTLCIRVGEHAAEKHLVGRETDARNKVRGAESRLLDLREVVHGVLVELKLAHLDERVVLLRPGLREVERVEAVGLRVLIRHDLHRDIPLREITVLDRLEEILAVRIGILTRNAGRLLVREVLDALLGVEVVLDPRLLAGLIHPHVGVRAVAVHVTPGLRKTTRTHEVGDLVSALRREGPEVPLHGAIAQTRIGKALLRVNEVGELHGVAEEEDGGVVANDVVVALLRVELEGETAYVTPRVGRAELTGNGREAGEHRGLLPLLEKLRLRVLRDILGHAEFAESARALRVGATLRNTLAIETCKLLHKVHVVKKEGSIRANAQ